MPYSDGYVWEMNRREGNKPKSRRWGTKNYVTTGRPIPSYGSDRAYCVLPYVCRCVISFSHSSSTCCTPWSACKGSSEQNSLVLNPLLILLQCTHQNSQWPFFGSISSQMNHARIWVIAIDVYSSDVTGVNAFSWLPTLNPDTSSYFTKPPSAMVWGAIRYHMRYHLLQIPGTLKS